MSATNLSRPPRFPFTPSCLQEYHDVAVMAVGKVLDDHKVDVLWTNHVVYQPQIAAAVCPSRGIPFVMFPHGSAIEYTVRGNEKFLALVKDAILKCDTSKGRQRPEFLQTRVKLSVLLERIIE